MTRKDAERQLDYVRGLRIRLLGDRVLQEIAWKAVGLLGWPDIFDAEYVALTQLHIGHRTGPRPAHPDAGHRPRHQRHPRGSSALEEIGNSCLREGDPGQARTCSRHPASISASAPSGPARPANPPERRADIHHSPGARRRPVTRVPARVISSAATLSAGLSGAPQRRRSPCQPGGLRQGYGEKGCCPFPARSRPGRRSSPKGCG